MISGFVFLDLLGVKYNLSNGDYNMITYFVCLKELDETSLDYYELFGNVESSDLIIGPCRTIIEAKTLVTRMNKEYKKSHKFSSVEYTIKPSPEKCSSVKPKKH